MLMIRAQVAESRAATQAEIASSRAATTQQIAELHNMVATEIGRVRLEGARNMDDIKTWTNGSFMRAKEVQQAMDGLDHRLTRLADTMADTLTKLLSERSPRRAT